ADFDKDDAARGLFRVAKWKEEAQAFGADIQARNVFGLQFRGVDTDFYGFELLSAFYRTVDATFVGPANREIRTLLKTGELDLIGSIPDVRIDDESMTFTGLDAAVADTRREIDRLRQVVVQLRGLVSILKEPVRIVPDQLEQLRQSAQRSSEE